MKSGIEKLNKMIGYIYKAELLMGIVVICLITLIACKMPEIMEKEKVELTTRNEEEEKSKGTTIIVDPGHGGVDPGKIGINGALEKDINLEIALKLREELEDEGYRIVMTRETDTGLYGENDSNKKRTDMNKRCELINAEYAKDSKMINISIHQNSYLAESVKGPQTFFYSKSEKSTMLANIMQNTINEDLQVEKPRTEKSNDNYFMLVKTNCPSVIIECGFLSNWEDAQNLADDVYQQKLVDSICKGVKKYYQICNSE